VEFVTPARFESLGAQARAMGFKHVASGPLVRSSYHAGELLQDATADRYRPG
jgi:lipoic acid synthetase